MNKVGKLLFVKGVLLGALFVMFPVNAQAAEEFDLVIRDHRFQPEELVIPQGQKVKIRIDNQDATAEEFESNELNREKMIGGKSKAVIFLGPLKPGTYKFFGEFHQDTAQGVILVKET